ncbi:MAG TPA: hypothetical protein PKY77_01585 [Phycisphaerae bacterium]|nr:hypothetical protein [Phycisphaerae bacterium]HRY68023.1 hypothetical protein [Phycisphaerae bacterium]HSA26760.1 hypothetical protein [Phycisphaerae bacterium]
MYNSLPRSDAEASVISRRRLLASVSYGALAALGVERIGLGPAGAAIAEPTSAPASAAAASSRGRFKYVGWQVGVTYQAKAPGGLTRDEMMRLVDDMARYRMNLLSLQMISYTYFDPHHDGYCWPVKNPKLRHLWDSTAINGRPETEYVREVIEAAAQRGIKVQMIMNWGIWNPDKLRRGYPDAAHYEKRPQAGQPPSKPSWTFCPDAPGSWQAGLDEIADLLGYYSHPNLTSYVFEHLASCDCFCPHTQRRYQADTGKLLLEATEDDRYAWAKRHIGGLLKKYVEHIRRIRPKMGVWLHTSCAKDWGHDPKMLPGCGFDHLLPHTFHFPITKERFYEKLRFLEPNRCVLHFSARDVRPTNYRLWIQTPESIAERTGWVLDYPGKNIAGVLFYNPNAMSPRNIQAVYEQTKRFDG